MMKNLFLFATFILFISCETNVAPQPAASSEHIDSSITRLRKQLDEHIFSENHEAGIRDFILLLDYAEKLPAGSRARMDASWTLLHYANRMRLYAQGIELTDQLLSDIKQDTSSLAIEWKQKLHASKASFYFEMRRYDKARQSYHQELQYQELLFPGGQHLSIINNIGMSYQFEGHLDSAMYYFRKVESSMNRAGQDSLFGDPQSEEIFAGSLKDNIASILVQQGHYQDAAKLYRENFSMYRKYAMHPYRLINAGLQLARLQIKFKMQPEAEKTIHELDSFFQVNNYYQKREQELEFYLVRAGFHELAGNAREAIRFQNAYINLSDSLNLVQLEGARHVSAELIQYKVNQFMEEIDREKREALHTQQKARLRFWILLLIIFFSLSGGLFLTTTLRQRLRLARKQAELNEAERMLTAAHAKAVEQEKAILDVALQHKSKDISTLALNASIKKEWAEKLDGLLSQAEQSRGHIRSLALRKLREEIRSHIHADQRISQLHQNIETLSSEFYDQLNARNPELSKTEIRLASFLKMRMSTDEIAMLQGISTKSVIMSRYRLKKKLALPESADLDAFCQTL